MLAAAGAVIGLIMAGYALFSAKGTSTLRVPAEDVALVNQQPIARSDFILLLKTQYNLDYAQTTAAQRKQVLESLIREELFVQRGKELDVASADADVRTAMVNAVEQGMTADVTAGRPTDEALKSYYLQNRSTYSSEGWMIARELVFPNAQSAAAELALHSGRKVDAVLTEFHGKDSGRLNRQEFYFAAKIHLGDGAFDAARILTNDTFSPPVAFADGVHIFDMIENHLPTPQSFDEARPRVFSDYQKAAMARMLSADEQFLRKRANVLIADDLR